MARAVLRFAGGSEMEKHPPQLTAQVSYDTTINAA